MQEDLTMITPVTSAAQTQAAAPSTAASPKTAPPKPPPTPRSTDTVNLSSAKAIVQESLETSAQTTKEAASGDIQARNLLAKQAAAKAHPK
jgi:hypothetical protein